MNTTRTTVAAALLSLAMFATTGLAANAQYGYYGHGPAPQSWEAPPAQFIAAQQRGYRDGVEGARKDFDNHRPPNVNNRDEYRNPHFIAPPDRADYQHGFREGYRTAVEHIYGAR